MKRRYLAVLAVIGAVAAFVTVACGRDEIDKITVAYFPEWPTANQIAQNEKTYDEELGVEVEWRTFWTGIETNEAIAAGEVQIVYAQGVVPWVVAVSNGQRVKLLGVAISYSEADNCIVHSDTGITQSNAKELEGKKVATTIGNMTHYKLLRTLDYLDVDADKIDIVEMDPPAAAAALARAEVAMACAFGGPLQRMREFGHELMPASEQEAIGIRVFDVVVATEEFVDEHPDLMRKFMEVTEQSRITYESDPDRYTESIAQAAGMDVESARSLLDTFTFLSAEEQKSEEWLGGAVQQFAKDVAQYFVQQGLIDQALDSYDFAIDDSFLP